MQLLMRFSHINQTIHCQVFYSSFNFIVVTITHRASEKHSLLEKFPDSVYKSVGIDAPILQIPPRAAREPHLPQRLECLRLTTLAHRCGSRYRVDLQTSQNRLFSVPARSTALIQSISTSRASGRSSRGHQIIAKPESPPVQALRTRHSRDMT